MFDKDEREYEWNVRSSIATIRFSHSLSAYPSLSVKINSLFISNSDNLWAVLFPYSDIISIFYALSFL